ncbi:DoxX-like family protein, partial [Bacillus cereus]
IVPKLVFTHSEELKMLSVMIGSTEHSIFVLKIIGLLEIIFGVLWLLPFPKRKVFFVHIFMLIVLMIAAG